MIVALAVLGFAVPLPAQTGAPAGRVKLSVRETGVYRVTGADLSAASVKLDEVAPDKIALFCQGQPVACRITGADGGRFSDGSAIVFYGEALDTRYTDTNVYWVAWDGEAGARMGELALADGAQKAIESFRATLHLEENREYIYLIWTKDKGELRPWFWKVIKSGGAETVSFDLPHLANAGGPATVRVMLQGRTVDLRVKQDHHAIVEVNGQAVGEAFCDDQETSLVTAQVALGVLKAGGNELAIRVPGDTELKDRDQVVLDWIEVEYPRTFAYEKGSLAVTLDEPGSATAQVTGVEGEVLELYDVTAPAETRVADDLRVVDGGARIALPSGGHRKLVAVTPGDHLTPARIELRAPTTLRSKNRGADYIIIAHDDFVEAIEPLAAHRAQQDALRVDTIPVSWIYDEFSHGIFTPHAIQDFLRYAYSEWQPPAPKYVLLVGDANYDYRDYTGTGLPNYVPAYAVRLQSGIETATDFWYVCVEGKDQTPEMAVGRFPASTPEQVSVLVQKTLAYEKQDTSAPWAKRVLVIADHELEVDRRSWFEVSMEEFWQYLRTYGYEPEAHYLSRTGITRNSPAEENRERVRSTATPEIIKTWTSGVALVVYEGHGGATRWSAQQVFEAGDVGKLRNSLLPVCIDVTCFTGQFDRPNLPNGQCLAEILLTAPEGGAVACVTPSRLGGLAIHHAIAQQIVEGKQQTLGLVVAFARHRFTPGSGDYWADRDTYNLLGDPALSLRISDPVPRVAEGPEGAATQTDAGSIADGATARIDEAGVKTRTEPFVFVGPQPPDQDGNALDDRLDRVLARGPGPLGGDPSLFLGLLLRAPADERLEETIRASGAVVRNRGPDPPAVLVEVRLSAVRELLGRVADTVQFVRLEQR